LKIQLIIIKLKGKKRKSKALKLKKQKCRPQNKSKLISYIKRLIKKWKKKRLIRIK